MKVKKASCSKNMRIKESELNVCYSIFSFIQIHTHTIQMRRLKKYKHIKERNKHKARS